MIQNLCVVPDNVIPLAAYYARNRVERLKQELMCEIFINNDVLYSYHRERNVNVDYKLLTVQF